MEEKNREKDIKKIAKGAGIVSFGDIISRIVAFAAVVITTRAIGADAYGIFLLAFTVIGIGEIFCKAGFDNGVLRFVSIYKGQNDFSRIKGVILSALRISFLISLTAGSLLFFFAGSIANNVFNEPAMENVIKSLIFLLPVMAITTIFLSTVWGLQFIKYKVYVEKLLRPIIRLILLFILFLMGFRLFGVILATVASFVIAGCFALYYLAKTFPFYKKDIKPVFETKNLVKFSFPLLFMEFLVLLAQRIDMLMIGYFKTSADVGIYGAAAKAAFLGIFAFSAFNPVFKPMISELHARGEIKKMEHIFKMGARWVFLVSFPVYLVMIFFAKPIMNILGPAFPIGAPCLIILSIGYLFHVWVGASSNIIMMTGRPNINLSNAILFCGINIILNYILIPKYGIIGAATATAISMAAVNFIRVTEVYYFLKIHPFALNFFKPFLAGAIAILVTYPFGFLAPPISIALFITIYVLLLKLFGFEKEEKLIFRSLIKKLR